MDSELHREVALKQIQTHHADDPASRPGSCSRPRSPAGWSIPGVVPVYGLGTNDEGRPFYAMRFVRGESLKEAIDRFHRADAQPGRDPAERTLSLRQLLGRFIDVCNAIAYAHSRGVIHRDLKPANICWAPTARRWSSTGAGQGRRPRRPDAASDGRADAAPRSHSGSGETMAGVAIGTPSYMSPEQADGRPDGSARPATSTGWARPSYCLVTGRPRWMAATSTACCGGCGRARSRRRGRSTRACPPRSRRSS